MKLCSVKGILSIAGPAILLSSAALLLLAQAHHADGQLGYTDTPIIPGQKWHVHDSGRPRPRTVTPSSVPGGPPSDAIVLFDGKDLSKWENQKKGQSSPAAWKVENGYIECVGGTGDLVTKEKFGDIQLHVEWASPVQIEGSSQARGNSGILLMHRYELQVLDSSNNPTYADGQAGAIYGWWPPLVNAAKKPGEWQTYDVVFEAPKFEGDKLSQPAYLTVFSQWNRFAQQAANRRTDGASRGTSLRGAWRGGAACISGPRHQGSIQEHLGPPAYALRPAVTGLRQLELCLRAASVASSSHRLLSSCDA